MSSVMQKIRRKKSNRRDFQITVSVNLLSIESKPDEWCKRPKKEGSDRKTIPKRPVGGGLLNEFI